MQDRRLVPEIKYITVIEYDVATLKELKELQDGLLLPKDQIRERDHLYVIRLKKGEPDFRLFLAPEWPTEYQALVENGNSDPLISIEDDQELLRCSAGQKYGRPEDVSPSISAEMFTKYGNLVANHCQKEIREQKHDNKKTGKAALRRSSHHLTEKRHDRSGGDGQGASDGGDGSFDEDDNFHHQDDTPQSLFNTEEEERITTFFGSDLVDSIKKLQAVFDKKAEADKIAERDGDPVEEYGKQELTTLIQTLKDRTPGRKMDKKAASEDEGVQEIAKAAQALEEKLKLSSLWENAQKLLYKIIGVILLAAPGAVAGFMAAALVGAVVGVGVGGFAGYKIGNRIGNFFSPVHAKAEYSGTINEAVSSRMKRK